MDQLESEPQSHHGFLFSPVYREKNVVVLESRHEAAAALMLSWLSLEISSGIRSRTSVCVCGGGAQTVCVFSDPGTFSWQ